VTTVFISYDRDDSDFAELVQAKLSRAGHTTFMDLEILDVGDDWRDKIDLALRASQVLVVIMTPEAAASHYVAYEWAFALGAGLKVIPLELQATDLHPRLAVLQRILFTDKARPWQKLLDEVQKVPDITPKDTVRVMESAPSAVKKAVNALDSLDPEEQERAVISLAQMNHPTAQDALIAALQHPSKNVRIKAAYEAQKARVKDPRVVSGLLEVARYQGSNIAGQWLPEFAVFVGSPATPVLIGALSDEDADVRRLAAYTLGRMGERDAVPGLIQILVDPEADVRAVAAEALDKIGATAASESLLKLLKDESGGVRSAAVRALGNLKYKSALPGVLERLRGDPVANVRADAAHAMGQIGDSAVVADLLDTLKREKGRFRREAAWALGQIGDPVAITPLREILYDKDEDNNARCRAAEALVFFKDETSLSEIADVAINRYGNYSEGFTDTVRALEGMREAAVPALLKILDKCYSKEVAEALKRVGSTEALDAVRKWEFET
jgi:HEAT repeat protein